MLLKTRFKQITSFLNIDREASSLETRCYVFLLARRLQPSATDNVTSVPNMKKTKVDITQFTDQLFAV